MALKDDILAQGTPLKGNYKYSSDPNVVRNTDGSLNFADDKMDCSEFVLYATKMASPDLYNKLTEVVPSGNRGGNTKTIQNGIMDIMGWTDLTKLAKTGAGIGDWILWDDHIEIVEDFPAGGRFLTLGANGAAGGAVPKNINCKNFDSVKAISTGFLGIWTPQLASGVVGYGLNLAKNDYIISVGFPEKGEGMDWAADVSLRTGGPVSDLKTPIHLKADNAAATMEADPPAGQAFPLYENGTVPFNASDTVAGKIQAISDTIAFLAVNDASHTRYIAKGSNTFCNIYACDLSYLMGDQIDKYFIPRVWWTANAIIQINNGVSQTPVYGTTVGELNANDLYQWFIDYGRNFGWLAQSDLNDLQEYVNTYGEIGVIVARKTGGHGHITVVVPEQSAPGGIFAAVRDETGKVINPLQSQAGSKNFEYGNLTIDGDPWFNSSSMEAGLYIFNKVV